MEFVIGTHAGRLISFIQESTLSLQDIIKMVPPPKSPIHAGTATSWNDVQHHFRGVLPSCLDEFGQTYGSGIFEGGNGYLEVFNPHDPAFTFNVEEYTPCYAGLKDDSPEFYPYTFGAQENGLIWIAAIAGSGPLPFFLQVTAHPDEYKVIFDDRNDGFTEFPDVPLFALLFDVLCNRTKINERARRT